MKPSKALLIAIVLFILDLGLTAFYINVEYGVIGEANPLDGPTVLVINSLYFVAVYVASKPVYAYQTIKLPSKHTLSYIGELYKSHHSMFIIISVLYSFVMSTLVTRGFIIFEWILFGIFKEAFSQSIYFDIRGVLPLQRFDIVFLGIAFIYFVYRWYSKQYEASKKMA